MGTNGSDLIEPLSEHLDEPLQLTLTARGLILLEKLDHADGVETYRDALIAEDFEI